MCPHTCRGSSVILKSSEPHPLLAAHCFFVVCQKITSHTHKLGRCGGTSVTPALRKLKQENCCEFKVSLCYVASQCCIAQPCLKQTAAIKKDCADTAKYPLERVRTCRFKLWRLHSESFPGRKRKEQVLAGLMPPPSLLNILTLQCEEVGFNKAWFLGR